MTLAQIREWHEANKHRIVPDEQAMMTKMIGALLAELAKESRCCPECSGGRPGGMICPRVWKRSHP